MTKHSTVLIALVLLIGATVPSFAVEGPNQTFTCTAKTFNECLMEAPCSAWKRSGPKACKLDTKIIFRGNPVVGETISGGTIVLLSQKVAGDCHWESVIEGDSHYSI